MPNDSRKRFLLFLFGVTFVWSLIWTVRSYFLTGEIRRPSSWRKDKTRWRHPRTTTRRGCAINLYGLPRSFRDLVLPTLLQNVVKPNLAYACDYFLHYYNVTHEAAGRSGKGGPIHPEHVYLIRDAIQDAARRDNFSVPQVVIMGDNEDDFERQHASFLQKIRSKETPNPYLIKLEPEQFVVDVVVNIVKMWHSQTAVWNMMSTYASTHSVSYERVGMLRSDVVYITEIDLYHTANKEIDVHNNHSVVPGFSMVSNQGIDRLFYGPHEAVKIWASKRFDMAENHIRNVARKNGMGLHSENFVQSSVFPAIKNLSIAVDRDPELCIIRVRADGSIWTTDCGTPPNNKKVLENLLERNCSEPYSVDDRPGMLEMKCPTVD